MTVWSFSQNQNLFKRFIMPSRNLCLGVVGCPPLRYLMLASSTIAALFYELSFFCWSFTSLFLSFLWLHRRLDVFICLHSKLGCVKWSKAIGSFLFFPHLLQISSFFVLLWTCFVLGGTLTLSGNGFCEKLWILCGVLTGLTLMFKGVFLKECRFSLKAWLLGSSWKSTSLNLACLGLA